MKKISVILLIISILMGFNVTSFAKEPVEIEIFYFGTDSCINCYSTYKFINKVAKDFNDKGINVIINNFDISKEKNEDLFWKYLSNYNVSKKELKVIPAVFIGDTAFIGEEKINNNLIDKISYYSENPTEYKVKSLNTNSLDIKTLKMGVFAVILGGILDGLNPCSISMMLFFISFSLLNQKKGKLIFIGFYFCLGTFVAYYGIGIGLLKFMYIMESIRILSIIFYSSLIIMSLFLIILNIKDYIAIKQNNYGDIKNQLSSNTKKKIHNIIKEKSNEKALYISAFISAFLISFFEFFCTGQIYLPMITYMINLKINLMSNYVLLAIYNLSFVFPLIIITLILSYGKEVVDISQILLDKLGLIKLIGALFFTIVTITMGIQLLKFL